MRAPDCGTQVTAARPERRPNATAIATFYEAAVMLAVFLLFGHCIEVKAPRLLRGERASLAGGLPLE